MDTEAAEGDDESNASVMVVPSLSQFKQALDSVKSLVMRQPNGDEFMDSVVHLEELKFKKQQSSIRLLKSSAQAMITVLYLNQQFAW